MMDQDAPTFKLTHYVGYLDDRHNGGDGFIYNRTEFMFDKRFWFSAFGHLDMRIETGMIWQKVPFTHLYMPQSGTSIFLSKRAFIIREGFCDFTVDVHGGVASVYYNNFFRENDEVCRFKDQNRKNNQDCKNRKDRKDRKEVTVIDDCRSAVGLNLLSPNG